jgi:hypothetical protein
MAKSHGGHDESKPAGERLVNQLASSGLLGALQEWRDVGHFNIGHAQRLPQQRRQPAGLGLADAPQTLAFPFDWVIANLSSATGYAGALDKVSSATAADRALAMDL